jgi:hypothetical protein
MFAVRPDGKAREIRGIDARLCAEASSRAAQVEANLFRDSKIGAALRHLPSGYPAINRAWMWAALLAASIAGWLHQLTATHTPSGLIGDGLRGGQAMIATLRHRLVRIPARLTRHAGALTLHPPPGYGLLDEVLTRIRALPTVS